MIKLRVVRGVTTHFITRLPEWGNTFVLLLYGQTLLERSNAFDLPQFAVMAHYATEDVWGWSLLVMGLLRLGALILNGTFDRIAAWSLRVRAASATLCCFAWFCITLGLYLGSPDTPGWKTYGLHLIVDMILAIHLGGQAGKVDRGLWNGRST